MTGLVSRLRGAHAPSHAGDGALAIANFSPAPFASRLAIYFAVCATLLVGCQKKSEIKVYRVSKAPLEEAGPMQSDMAPTNAPSPGVPHGMTQPASTNVETPPNWEPQPLSQMRQASFLVKGENGAIADISLVRLGSAAGNVLENVNRWLDQLGQPPVTEEKLSKIAERMKTPIGELTIVDLVGLPKGADPAKDGRTVAAMISTGNSTMFFKMRGNAELAESEKAEFIKWAAAVCNSPMASNSPMEAATPNSSNPPIKWKTPEDWTEVPPSSMRYASFATAPKGEKIDISVVTFPGDGGSDADNVNRWRSQIGLPGVDAAAINSSIVPLKTADTTFSTIDITGPKARTIAAWTRRDGHVWFIKATGPNAAVEGEKASFAKFVESVRF